MIDGRPPGYGVGMAAPKKVHTYRRRWASVLGVLVLIAACGIVLMILARADVLPRGWGYVGLVIAGPCAVAAVVTTVTQMRAESVVEASPETVRKQDKEEEEKR